MVLSVYGKAREESDMINSNHDLLLSVSTQTCETLHREEHFLYLSRHLQCHRNQMLFNQISSINLFFITILGLNNKSNKSNTDLKDLSIQVLEMLPPQPISKYHSRSNHYILFPHKYNLSNKNMEQNHKSDKL